MRTLEIILLVITIVALLWTKALDVISTFRFVGVSGETNPIARWFFKKTGLSGGIGIVCVIYIAIVSLAFWRVFSSADPFSTYGAVGIGLLVALIQYDVARFNTTRRHTIFTRFFLRVFAMFNRR